MAEEILPGAAERAASLLADVAEQRWEQATSGFDERMAKALDARGLAEAWAQVTGADRPGQLRSVRAGHGPVLPDPALNQP